MKEPAAVDIVIVNYFSLKKIQLLLESIKKSKFADGHINVIIVSNSHETITEQFKNDADLTFIQNKTNIGFGSACNIALPYCKTDYILLLNPDTLITKNTLSKCYEFMTSHRDITVLGVKHYNVNNQVVPSCSRFFTLRNQVNQIFGLSTLSPKVFKNASVMFDFNYNESGYVDQVMGAFMMIRETFIRQYGFMDERYFVFGEDMDFCKKVWDNGGKVFYNADISIIHEGGASTENISPEKLCYSLEGRLIYAHKHFNKWKWLLLLLLIIIAEPLMRTGWALFTLQLNKIKETWLGYFLFLRRARFK